MIRLILLLQLLPFADTPRFALAGLVAVANGGHLERWGADGTERDKLTRPVPGVSTGVSTGVRYCAPSFSFHALPRRKLPPICRDWAMFT